jgi:S1-C subfamily serine protease
MKQQSNAFDTPSEGNPLSPLITALFGLLSVLAVAPTQADAEALPSPEPFISPLDMHPADMASYSSNAAPSAVAIPKVIHQGDNGAPDQRQISLPMIVTPSPRGPDETGNAIGRAGTGFFVAADGTLLTAAHVVKDCGRTQIISKYVTRGWASLVAADQTHDIAVLKAMDLRPPAIVRVSGIPPVSDRLFVLGYPSSAGLTVAAGTWGVTQNQKFPANVGGLANPRELLWISAPDVTHGYSGGPIFDPKLGAVVGIVKGEVEGGYLRLVHDITSTGIAIGPGISPMGTVLRRDAPYVAISPVSSPVEVTEDTLRRATVHVLCWR